MDPRPAPLPPPVQDVERRACAVRLVLLDVDGVLTDGTLYLGEHGEEYKTFSARDGHGIKMLQQTGVVVGIVSGRSSGIVARRAAELGIAHLHQGCADKRALVETLLHELGLDAAQVAFVGDDIVDLPIMLRVGFAIAVRDAHELVRRYAHWVTASSGGRGAVREVCERIMCAQGTYAAEIERYL